MALSARYRLSHCLKLCAVVVAALTLIQIFFTFGQRPGFLQESQPTAIKLHYLVPATSGNKNLCRLLLSGFATGQATPSLLMWGRPEYDDEYKNHMEKVETVLQYLNDQPSESDDDLVLIIDGYDIWHQLPPNVLISRYYEVMRDANERLAKEISYATRKIHGIHQSVLFGPDKICWPEDMTRPACWAVPESTLPRWAFGPETDSGAYRDHYRPRWLNSGTIMGPVKDVRHVFDRTLSLLTSNRSIDSDQFYFANIWGLQEYQRKVLAGAEIPNHLQVAITDGWAGDSYLDRIHVEEPDTSGDAVSNVESHITIDYRSSIFQTAAYYSQYLSWRKYRAENADDDALLQMPLRDALPSDLAGLDGPLSHLSGLPSPLVNLTWSDIPLGTNEASKEIFSLLHFTPPKHLRDFWWPRMWYFPHGRDIVKAAKETSTPSILGHTPLGQPILPAKPMAGASAAASELFVAFLPGTTEPNGLTWSALCGMHEDALFDNSWEDGDVKFPQ